MDFVLAADERIDFPQSRLFVEIDGIGFQGIRSTLFGTGFFFGTRGAALTLFVFLYLGNPVGDVIHHVEAGDVLPAEKISRVGFAFAEYGNQNVSAVHFFFTGRLNVENGALQDPLETQSRLRFPLVVFGKQRRVFLDKLGQVVVQTVQICAASPQYFRCGGIIK